jgi:hypothetical protein
VLFRSIESLRGFIPLPDGGFFGVARGVAAPSGGRVYEVWNGGTRFANIPMSGSGYIEPHNITGNYSHYFVTSLAGIYHFANFALDSAFNYQCNTSWSSWWGINLRADGGVLATGPRGKRCDWSGGVATPSDLAGSTTDTVYTQLLFPSGEAFFGSENGTLLHAPLDGGPIETFVLTADTWQVQTTGNNALDVWAVSDVGAVARWQGSWSLVGNVGQRLFDVWASGPDDVWAAGDVVVRRDPATGDWNTVALPAFDAGTNRVLYKSIVGHDGHDLLVSGSLINSVGDEQGFVLLYTR